jgi:2-C-methyl-D-erythritol 4-phosphate cytidylyltransferase/2-C-methyl-D-erythritol 2,4-cyclodiphosphate synthase
MGTAPREVKGLRTAALIVAGGRGTRASTPRPKQYAMLGGLSVLARSVLAFLDCRAIGLVQVVIAAGDAPLYAAAIGAIAEERLLAPTRGGATRQRSVRNGLRALAEHAPDLVLIHDAARPFLAQSVIMRVLAALADAPAAIAAIPLTDTLKAAVEGNRVSATLERTGLWRAQTPQGFRFADILAAHEAADKAGLHAFTDDAALAAWAKVPVEMVMGSEENRKLTTPADLAAAERASAFPDVRTGQGFDVHRLVAGDHVWLCGIRLAHDRGLEGHSDADVALHALTDALLGAVGDGDIGEHFPDTDPRWKGAASELFVREALRRIGARNGHVSNVDVTILCEAPRIAPHRAVMRARLAELLQIDSSRIGVKATTSEGLGFTGRREGIAALASATVILRPPPRD